MKIEYESKANAARRPRSRLTPFRVAAFIALFVWPILCVILGEHGFFGPHQLGFMVLVEIFFVSSWFVLGILGLCGVGK